MKKSGKNMRIVLLLVLYCLLPVHHLLSPIPAGTAEGQINITADSVEHHSETDTYMAKGSVKIVFEDATLTADEMQLDGKTSDAVATGNVVYEDREVIMKADRLEMNLETKLGNVHNAYLFYKNENFHIRGDTIEKTGDTSFFSNRATLTTCDADIPAWSIAGTDVTVNQHKDLSTWHGKLLVKNRPFLYTPYFWAPILQERQTGFLFPTFGYSSTRGYYYKQGFFWAIQDNQDATVYIDYYSEKKFAEGFDYRYIITPGTNGEVWVYHAKDNNESRDLYEVKSYHNLELPGGTSAYLKVHAVNEFDYYRILDSTSSDRFGLSSWETSPFGFSSDERRQKYLESTAQLSKMFGPGRAYVLAQTRQSLEGSSSEIPQTLPEIGLVINTMSKGPFSFNASATGVHFWRKDGQTGTRFDVYPNFYVSYGRLVNLTQKVGLRETAYTLDDPSLHENRLIADFRTSLSTKLARTYSSLIHIIEPSLSYEFIPRVDQDNIPFFDSIDSIPHTSSIGYSLTNRLSGLEKLNLESRLRLSQSYSLLDVEKHFSPILMEAFFKTGGLNLHMNASYDVHDRQISETIASVMLKNKTGFIGAGKNYRRSSSLDQVTFEAGMYHPIMIYDLKIPIELEGKVWYDLNGNGVQEIEAKATYVHQCWGFTVSYNRKTDEYQIVFAVELKGLGTVKLGSI